MQLPNLIIAGVRKAGTTSLFHYLRQHPDVCACQLKEPAYFIPLKYGRVPEPLDEYRKLFAHSRGERYLMEATPSYFGGGADIAYPLARTLPNPRVIVSLRDPVDAFCSNFNFLRSRLQLDANTKLADYVAACEQMHARKLDRLYENRAYNSLRAGLYAEFLPAWRHAHGENLKVLFFEDLKRDPRRVVESLCEWLGISAGPVAKFDFSIENKTEQYRIRWLQHVALGANRRWKPWFRRYHGVKKTLRKAYYAVNANPARNGVVSGDVRTRLQTLYAEPNARLADQLRLAGYTRLPGWLKPTAPAIDTPTLGLSARARPAMVGTTSRVAR